MTAEAVTAGDVENPPLVTAPGPDTTTDAADVAAEAPDAALTPVDQLFYALSSAADHGLLWLAIGSARAARTGEPAIALKLAALLGAESIVTNGIVKSFFRRVRPQEHFTHDAPLPYGMHRPITSSFPSGHAASAFMAATLLAKGTRAAPAYYALAGLVAYSRVHVRMHHAADVVGGAALGLALGAIARRFVSLDR
ncbi:MAG: phosphatase PAP2 family protein [Acidimicrobiia bacterium]|jgi:undecaprenyl-diphosphatase